MPKKLSLLAGLGATLLALSLSACDPAGVPGGRGEALISVDIGSNGDGKATIYSAYGFGGDAEALRALGTDVGRVLFPTAELRVAVDSNDGGADLPVIYASHLYEPGPHPSVTITTDGLASALASHGITRSRLAVCGPTVPSTLRSEPRLPDIKNCEHSQPLSSDQPVMLQLEMRPRSVNVWPMILLSWLASLAAMTAAVGVALKRRRPKFRPIPVPSALAAIALAISTLTLGNTANPDNAGVFGTARGPLLAYSHLAGLVAFGAIAVAVAFFFVARASSVADGAQAA